MENSNKLHPLIATAALSVIVLCAAGVAALSGVLPLSSGKPAETPAAVVAPAAREPIPQQVVVVQVPQAAPARKPIVRASTRPRAYQEAVYRDFDEERAPVLAQAPQPAPLLEPLPAPQIVPQPAPPPGNLGTVESVREIAQPGEGHGLGAVAGGVAGAVVGKQFGNGSGKKLMTLLGAAGGAYAGHQAEKQLRATRRWEISVRLDDGSTRTVSFEYEPSWRSGDRVRLVEGRLQAA